MFIYDSCNNDETIWKSRNYVTSKCSHCWYVQGVKNKKKKTFFITVNVEKSGYHSRFAMYTDKQKQRMLLASKDIISDR